VQQQPTLLLAKVQCCPALFACCGVAAERIAFVAVAHGLLWCMECSCCGVPTVMLAGLCWLMTLADALVLVQQQPTLLLAKVRR
jgi:hypothetical protein